MRENDPSSVLLFLVGTKKDLSVGEMDPECVSPLISYQSPENKPTTIFLG